MKKNFFHVFQNLLFICLTKMIERSYRIGKTHASHAGYLEIGSRSSQIDDLYNSYLSLPSLALGMVAEGKNWLAQCKDNMTEWDIGSSWWQPDFPVGQYYDVSMSRECALCQVGTHPNITLNVDRM